MTITTPTTEPGYNGFLVECSRPDIHSVGGVRRSRFLAITKSPQEAIDGVAVIMGSAENVSIVDSGPDVLIQAKVLGVLHGRVKLIVPR
jgi:hypothetical protein